MEKAEKAAEKKEARKRKITPGGDRSRGGKRPQFQQPRPQPVVATPTHFQMPAVTRRALQPATPRQLGPCFSCGQMGHIRSYCPKTTPPSSKT